MNIKPKQLRNIYWSTAIIMMLSMAFHFTVDILSDGFGYIFAGGSILLWAVILCIAYKKNLPVYVEEHYNKMCKIRNKVAKSDILSDKTKEITLKSTNTSLKFSDFFNGTTMVLFLILLSIALVIVSLIVDTPNIHDGLAKFVDDIYIVFVLPHLLAIYLADVFNTKILRLEKTLSDDALAAKFINDIFRKLIENTKHNNHE